MKYNTLIAYMKHIEHQQTSRGISNNVSVFGSEVLHHILYINQVCYNW